MEMQIAEPLPQKAGGRQVAAIDFKKIDDPGSLRPAIDRLRSG